MRIEAHITVDLEDGALAQAIGLRHGWTFSQVQEFRPKAGPMLGAVREVGRLEIGAEDHPDYLDAAALDVVARKMAAELRRRDVNVRRERVVRVLRDTAHGIDEIEGSAA